MPNVGEIFWVKSERTVSKFRKRKGNFLCCAHLLHKSGAWNRTFHVAVGEKRLRNVQKSVMHVQSWFFANLNLLFFFCCSPSPLQNSLLLSSRNFATMVTWRYTSPLYRPSLFSQGGSILASFFFCVFFGVGFVSQKRKRKKRTYPISILPPLLVNKAYIHLIAITFYSNQGFQTKEWNRKHQWPFKLCLTQLMSD